MNAASRKRRRRQRKRTRVVTVLGDTVNEFCTKVGVSRATAFRMMKRGDLRYVQLGPRSRRIITSEYQRLGFLSANEEA